MEENALDRRTLREIVYAVRAAGALLLGVAAVSREVRTIVHELRRNRRDRRGPSPRSERRYVTLERAEE